MSTVTGVSSRIGGSGKNKHAVILAPDMMTWIPSALFYNRNVHNLNSYIVIVRCGLRAASIVRCRKQASRSSVNISLQVLLSHQTMSFTFLGHKYNEISTFVYSTSSFIRLHFHF